MKRFLMSLQGTQTSELSRTSHDNVSEVFQLYCGPSFELRHQEMCSNVDIFADACKADAQGAYSQNGAFGGGSRSASCLQLFESIDNFTAILPELMLQCQARLDAEAKERSRLQITVLQHFKQESQQIQGLQRIIINNLGEKLQAIFSHDDEFDGIFGRLQNLKQSVSAHFNCLFLL